MVIMVMVILNRSFITIRDVKACIYRDKDRKDVRNEKMNTINEVFVVEIQTEFECLILLN